ncbi:hypothetical protein HY090_00090 [Candidatus Kaiserbacteria bacterium]|nr:hypothetical protein [Candidatus Kaiserbacteria bacterium]
MKIFFLFVILRPYFPFIGFDLEIGSGGEPYLERSRVDAEAFKLTPTTFLYLIVYVGRYGSSRFLLLVLAPLCRVVRHCGLKKEPCFIFREVHEFSDLEGHDSLNDRAIADEPLFFLLRILRSFPKYIEGFKCAQHVADTDAETPEIIGFLGRARFERLVHFFGHIS